VGAPLQLLLKRMSNKKQRKKNRANFTHTGKTFRSFERTLCHARDSISIWEANSAPARDFGALNEICCVCVFVAFVFASNERVMPSFLCVCASLTLSVGQCNCSLCFCANSLILNLRGRCKPL